MSALKLNFDAIGKTEEEICLNAETIAKGFFGEGANITYSYGEVAVYQYQENDMFPRENLVSEFICPVMAYVV